MRRAVGDVHKRSLGDPELAGLVRLPIVHSDMQQALWLTVCCHRHSARSRRVARLRLAWVDWRNLARLRHGLSWGLQKRCLRHLLVVRSGWCDSWRQIGLGSPLMDRLLQIRPWLRLWRLCHWRHLRHLWHLGHLGQRTLRCPWHGRLTVCWRCIRRLSVLGLRISLRLRGQHWLLHVLRLWILVLRCTIANCAQLRLGGHGRWRCARLLIVHRCSLRR
mmetsp:Transcript_143399/g.250080  ORF Transcript_143399/g.250080 Transcript_143399/m.250080 type:complete len:219 (-) Transcript_143399:416-1072(-)